MVPRQDDAATMPAPASTGPVLDCSSVRRIISAAIAEFGEKGYEATRIDDIGARAQTSKQLIYHYFGTKHALYVVAVEELTRLEHAWLMTENFDELPPACAIERLFDLMLTTKLANDHLFAADQILHHSAKFAGDKVIGKLGRRCIALLEQILLRGRQEGIFNPQVTAPQVMLHMVLLSTGFSAFRSIMPQYIGEDFSSRRAEEEWRKYALSSMLAALSIPHGAGEPDGAARAG